MGIKNEKITREAIKRYVRDELGHDRYRITHDGEVHGYGSTDPYNRSLDYWHYLGYVDEILAEIGKRRRKGTARELEISNLGLRGSDE